MPWAGAGANGTDPTVGKETQRRKPMRNKLAVLFLFALAAAAPRLGEAQSPSFEGKTVTIVVGFKAGGGYDRVARVLARHIPKYLPGNPNVIVQNMPGGNSIT